MAKVKNTLKAFKGTAKGMTKFLFNGTPPDQYEIPEGGFQVGEERVIEVTVRCLSSGPTYTDKGVVHKTVWRVVNGALGRLTKRPRDRDDPQLPYDEYESGADGEYSEEYGTGQPIDNGAAAAKEPGDEAEKPDDTAAEPQETTTDAAEATPKAEGASVHQFPEFSGKPKAGRK